MYNAFSIANSCSVFRTRKQLPSPVACVCVCVCVPYCVVDQGTGRGELESSPGARPLSGGRAVSRPTRLHSGV